MNTGFEKPKKMRSDNEEKMRINPFFFSATVLASFGPLT